MRNYMRRMAFGTPQKENVLGLLGQMRNLATALQGIHSLPDKDSQAALAPTPTSPTRKSGWHHDLKPENILFLQAHTHPVVSFILQTLALQKSIRIGPEASIPSLRVALRLTRHQI